MPTMFKEIQDKEDICETSDDLQGQTPDLILEHGKTRLTLDLDGWEWFWLFLAIIFVSSLWVWLSNV